MFRGREMVHTYRGREQLNEVVKQLGPIAKMESSPRMEGRFMSMILVADREAVAEAKRLAEEGAEATSTAPEEAATAEAAATENTSETQAEKPEDVSPAASE